MKGITNFVNFIAINWTSILVVISIILILINRVRSFLKLSIEERKEVALKIIREEILKLMSDAEIYWSEYEKSGALKKADVISNIYEKFPILNKVEDQDTLLEDINNLIDSTKDKMDEIMNKELEEVFTE